MATMGPVELSDTNNAAMLQELLQNVHQRDLTDAETSTFDALLSLSNNKRDDSYGWETLIMSAVRKNLYQTANSALKVLREKMDKAGLSLENLNCVSSEEVTLNEHEKGRLDILLALPGQQAPEAQKEGADEEKYSFTSNIAACKAGTLVIPKEGYIPPYEVGTGSRTITNFDDHQNVIQFALRKIEERKGVEPNLQAVTMTEAVREYKHSAVESFLVAVLDRSEKNAFVLAIYSPYAKPIASHVEKDYSITLRGDVMRHQVVVSSVDSNDFTLMAHSSTPHNDINQKRNEGFALKILSYNIWNFNGDWPTRRQLIVNTVREHQPSIVGFQEIRYRYASDEGNQLAQMANQLSNYNYVYQPAMRYDTDAEGVGILTTFPIVLTNYTNLKFIPGAPDSNKRIALRGLLDTPGGQFDFFVTHFSYSKGPGQMQNAVDLLNFMDASKERYPTQTVVGDFNIYTDSVGPTDFLTGKNPFHGKVGNLRDVWETVHGKANGYTFSNLPWSTGLINRADRILNRGDIRPTQVERVGEYKSADQSPASDHLGVLVTTQ